MCTVCGCSERPLAPLADLPSDEPLAGLVFSATENGDLHFGANDAGVSVPGLSAERCISIETRVLAANDDVATRNREAFARAGVLALNLVSSPGSGKTTLLVETIRRLRADGGPRSAVIEGDQQTSNDADRIRETGAPAVQVNTGKGCHLDAPMVAEAWTQLAPSKPQILFVENVGNLVCPAMWDLGEAAKVAILSVTEGEDKPLKYPDMFAAAELMLLNKTDLLPYLRFDVEKAIAAARQVNPGIEIIALSAFGGDGFEQWLAWLAARVPGAATTERAEAV